MFNNFVKSMMALCMVTSGWSTISSESPHGLTQSKIDNFFSNGNKEVDVRTQTIEEEKSQSTTSEAMNKSINTVGTLEIEGHSSGEEGGSGSDSLHYNKDADTSTSSEEVTETEVGSIVDDKVDGLDVRDKISGLVNAISVAYRRSQRGQNHEYCKQRIREAINELNNLGAINVVSPDSYALFSVLSSSFDVWWNDSSLSQKIKNKFIAAASAAGFQVDAVQKWMLSILSNFGD